MNTAISFVRAGGHLEQAARTLCLHKNTLRYRVNKLHSQLAPDLSDEDFYEALSTAIKIYLICQYRT